MELGSILPAAERLAELLRWNDPGSQVHSMQFQELDLQGSYGSSKRKYCCGALGVTGRRSEPLLSKGGLVTRVQSAAARLVAR